ncbi:hypothetical protein [Inquilinus limosus]|uniref:Uncharacterized protein n=1 Tax=Inquilinus limosus MP06 TaxID=1398085 RepID=A0A0A0DC68_9PROT|nr:hypothetical protein [Inquilinus limosus]KGM35709.1 hypothetical protein P409_03025 [Inquilinus limosus MP06]
MSRDRNAAPDVGAKFSLSDDGEELFSFVIDHGTTIGPRPATDEDREKHAEAYEAFLASAPEPEGDDPAPKRRPGRPRKA